MTLKHILTICALLLLAPALRAQSGTIQGRLTEGEPGQEQPIPFANVLVAGTTVGTTTDLDGNYQLSVEAGTYAVVFSFVGFGTDTASNVVVRPGEITRLDHGMGSSAIDIEEFEVVQKVDRERETVLLMDRKETTALVQNIGAQELKKKGANDVADGVKKVVGLSVVGDRYLMVRGMGDRYNAAYLNGLPLPSPDPDAKVAPLDIFPTAIVSSLSVNKAFTPELYGDFAGGAVDIRTKETTDETVLRVSMGGGLNTQTTFKDFRSYNGGTTDFWGFDDGTRDLPPSLAGRNPQLNSEVSPFRKNFDPTTGTARPDLNFGLFGATSFRLSEGVKLHVLASANYRNQHRYRNGKNRIMNALNIALIDYDFETWEFSTQSSLLGSATLELGKRHEVSFTSMMANISTDQFRENYGYHFDYAPDLVYARRYTFRQNQVRVNQVRGNHAFGIADRLQVDWAASMSTASSDEPDRRQLVYLYEPGAPQDQYRFNGLDRIENQRWYSGLDEEETSVHAGLAYRVLQREIEDDMVSLLTVRTGADMKSKQRDFGYDLWVYDLSQIGQTYPTVDVYTPDQYLDNENYGNGVYDLQNATTPDADHTIEQDIQAGYFAAEVDIIPRKLKVLGGARVEVGQQTIFYRKQSDSFFQPIRKATIDETDVLPYASVKYDINEKNVLRLSGSQTISRPGFREMAPFEYTEYFAGVKNVGNPELQNGSVTNVDARYEVYPTAGELIALGVFGKALQDPIEKVALATASGQLQSFANTDKGTVAGVELEVVKRLSFLGRSDSSFFNDLSIGFNASYLHSQVTIDSDLGGGDAATVVLTNRERPLQGASPYLINADLSWTKTFSDRFRGVATVAYNIYGKRVFAVGANGLGDQYEMPLGQLNLILRGEIGERWQANLTFRNLTDAQYRIEQENREGTAILNSYRMGMNVSFGVGYRIL